MGDIVIDELKAKAMSARRAARNLARLPTDAKNKALNNIARCIQREERIILASNAEDIEAGKASGLSESMLDRLMLDSSRLASIAEDVKTVAGLPDPIGESFDVSTLPNGLQIGRRRVPLGVIGAIYESRPNVTIDISVLCLKSGNSVILRGGSESIKSNRILAKVVRDAIDEVGLDMDSVQLIESTDRAIVGQMLSMKDDIDLMIPRGGADFIRFVGENAHMPVITGGVGVCHTYVDKHADINSAVDIAYNAKVQRPTVCNALDTLLVHSDIAVEYLPAIARAWETAGVEMHCDLRSMSIIGGMEIPNVIKSTEEDWGKEFLSLTAAVKIVDSLDEAIDHIDRYGSGHSEAIVSEDYTNAMRFLDEIDAAAVYVNASTRFTDGGQFGLGAEVAISTNKMHARGPMGLKELTSYKWTILGKGHIRG
ncbi:MAG: glutamate-5-semialdehyde dehydrogenase [SAR202 cluster bacterium]|nr:glutamate-5-semialdehyde dehydrogenase [SAR202 cluster bacterium]|tara:strand:- start:3415 stop:4692 length:1278 start_codon:yes stop_codon:yes gene_type:complete